MPKAWGGPEMTPREQYEVYEVPRCRRRLGRLVRKDRIRQRLLRRGTRRRQAARTLYPDLDFVTPGKCHPTVSANASMADIASRATGRLAAGDARRHDHRGFLVTENGKPVMSGGAPQSRIAFAPASHFEIIDTWHSTGLAGSGSNDYRVKDLFVPDAHTIAQDDPPQRSEPLYCYFGMFLASWHGVALGLARRAIDAALAVVEKKMHIFPPPPMPLRQRPHARVALAKAEMTYRAARAFTYETTDRIWEDAQVAGPRVAGLPPRDGAVAVIFVPRRARGCAVDVRPRGTDGRVPSQDTTRSPAARCDHDERASADQRQLSRNGRYGNRRRPAADRLALALRSGSGPWSLLSPWSESTDLRIHQAPSTKDQGLA